ncbi:hypothetical protein EDB89DRAFT_1902014 [Lactarius sanguifluus]|nr:hypothetical protein EDB89DRAFT_1902014 [Lactarius sanguifluus]
MVESICTRGYPCHGYGFCAGWEMATLTRTRVTRTRDPYGFCQPVTIPNRALTTPNNSSKDGQVAAGIPTLMGGSGGICMGRFVMGERWAACRCYGLEGDDEKYGRRAYGQCAVGEGVGGMRLGTGAGMGAWSRRPAAWAVQRA